jgi:phage terminase large subunit-like protein
MAKVRTKTTAKKPACSCGQEHMVRDYAAVCREHQRKVLTGEVPASPNYKASVALQVKLRENPPEGYLYDDEAGNKALRSIEKLHWGKGTVRGKPLRLSDWQVMLLHPLFALLDPVTQSRLYTSTSWWLSKGSGKSPLVAAVVDYLIAIDTTGGEFYSFATTQKQARIVFEHGQEILRKSPDIKERFQLNVEALHQVRGIGDPRVMEPRSSEQGSIEGGAPRVAVLDEVHLQIDDRLYQNIKTACDKVEGSLLLMISTCGVDAGPEACGMILYNRARDILNGKVDAPREYPFIIDADPKVDPWSRFALEQACPNLGVSQSLANLLESQKRAKQSPADQADFKIKHLNQWVQAGSAFIDIEQWRKLARDITIEKTLADPEWQNASWFIGLDFAPKRDLTAAPVVATRLVEVPNSEPKRQLRIFTKGMVWLPEQSITVENTPLIRVWAEQEWMILTPGPTLNPAIMKRAVITTGHSLPNCEIATDPDCLAEAEHEFAAEGFNVNEVLQGPRAQNAPMLALDAAISDASIEHDGSPVTEWCMGNLIARRSAYGIKPEKSNEYSKIDIAVAIINAMASATVAQLEDPPERDEQGKVKERTPVRSVANVNFRPLRPPMGRFAANAQW